MSTFQKLIKVFAIVLAVLMITSLVFAAVNIIDSILNIFDNNENTEDLTSQAFDIADIKRLDIEFAAANLKIISGDELQVTCDARKVNVDQSGSTLKIRDKRLHTNDTYTVTITLPEHSFERVELELGAGVLNMENLSCDRLDLELGAGEALISNINVNSRSDISSGAGRLTVENGSLGLLELDMGVGKVDISASLEDNSEIDCGVGDLVLALFGSADDYKLDVSKGLGNVSVDGISVSNGTVGSGNKTVKLDCGVGGVTITYSK